MYHVSVKIEKEISAHQVKQKIHELCTQLKLIPEYKSIVLIADVDPG